MANEGFRGERRIQRRYPIALELEYTVVEGGEVVGSGIGKTWNISSNGVLFQPDGAIANGPNVEISIRWPAVSPDEPFTELRMSGRVVRSDMYGTALQLCRYHFHKPDNSEVLVDRPVSKALIH